MRVRTIRTHSNEHGASYEKLGSAGAIYDVADEAEAKRLIKLGYVEKADGGTDARTSGSAKGVGRVSQGDSA